MKKNRKQDENVASAPPMPPAANVAPPAAAVEPTALPVEIIPISSIVYLVDNHRPAMDERKLQELADNIRAGGVKQPIKICRRFSERHPKGGINVMVFGHRRVKASELAGLTTIPAMVATGMTDQQIAEDQCIENIHNEDVGPIGEAYAVKTLLDGGRTIDAVASTLNQTVAWCTWRLMLLRLHKDVQGLVNRGRLPIGHAFEIAKVGDVDEQLELAYSAIGCHDRGRDAKSLEAAIADDYLEPLKSVRKTISWKLCKMGSAFWPKDTDYANRRPCAGCPDNTNTTPALFANIDLTSAKGNCTNPECYRAKAQAWERDPVKKARDKEREAQKAAAAKAQGKQPEENGKRGESDKQRQARVTALKKKFPWEPQQKLAVALWEYGRKALKDVLAYLNKTTPANAESVALFSICQSTNFYNSRPELLTLDAALAGKGISGKSAATILEHCNCIQFPEYMAPGVSYEGQAERVPLNKHTAWAIDTLERLCAAWNVKLPARPKESDFADKPLPSRLDALNKGVCRVCGCTEDKGCKGECAWVDGPKKTLCSACCVPDLFVCITIGSRTESLEGIRNAKLFVLQTAQDYGLKGDWRRVAVAKRIEQLQKGK